MFHDRDIDYPVSRSDGFEHVPWSQDGAAEIEAGRDEAGRVWIGISDRGPGIPEDQLQAVLAPFHRLESSRNRDTGGTGLGLAIAVQLAQSLGGSLRLRNREGGGLRAELQLPG